MRVGEWEQGYILGGEVVVYWVGDIACGWYDGDVYLVCGMQLALDVLLRRREYIKHTLVSHRQHSHDQRFRDHHLALNCQRTPLP